MVVSPAAGLALRLCSAVSRFAQRNPKVGFTNQQHLISASSSEPLILYQGTYIRYNEIRHVASSSWPSRQRPSTASPGFVRGTRSGVDYRDISGLWYRLLHGGGICPLVEAEASKTAVCHQSVLEWSAWWYDVRYEAFEEEAARQ